MFIFLKNYILNLTFNIYTQILLFYFVFVAQFFLNSFQPQKVHVNTQFFVMYLKQHLKTFSDNLLLLVTLVL